ncbi:MAG TPA: L,D-transpeptidase [Chloroflexi bacterium]|nr:L,D-transpeptidase [Chloroflexota bacterium]
MSEPLPPSLVALETMLRRDPRIGQSTLLLVVGAEQQLWRLPREGGASCWPVSTAREGFGNRSGSHRTPTGLHRVGEKIGAGSPPGTVFRGRHPTGEVVSPGHYPEQDLITTRILWLEGLEPGVNLGGEVDSRARYIYIHGTPEEALIGRPVSHGCIRMRNEDIVTLFEEVEVGTPVYILASPPPQG